MPTSACDSPVSATDRQRSPPAPMKKRRRIAAGGSGSAHDGSKAGCRRGWCTCASQDNFFAILAAPAWWLFNSSSAACARTIAAPCIHCRTAVEGLQVGIGRRWLGGFRRTDALFGSGLRGIFDFGLYRLAGTVLPRSAKQDRRFAVHANPLAAALAGTMAGGP